MNCGEGFRGQGKGAILYPSAHCSPMQGAEASVRQQSAALSDLALQAHKQGKIPLGTITRMAVDNKQLSVVTRGESSLLAGRTAKLP